MYGDQTGEFGGWDWDLGLCDLLTPLNIPKSNMYIYILLTGVNTVHI